MAIAEVTEVMRTEPTMNGVHDRPLDQTWEKRCNRFTIALCERSGQQAATDLAKRNGRAKTTMRKSTVMPRATRSESMMLVNVAEGGRNKLKLMSTRDRDI